MHEDKHEYNQGPPYNVVKIEKKMNNDDIK